MRQPGYYWVKYDNEWGVAYCSALGNWSDHYHYSLRDSDFEEIDERRIERVPIIERGCSDDYPVIDLNK